MEIRGEKGYWISTARIIDQEFFDEYIKKVGPRQKEINWEVFVKDAEPQGKENTQDSNFEVICEFLLKRTAVEAYDSDEYKINSNLRVKATENSKFTIMEGLDEATKLKKAMGL